MTPPRWVEEDGQLMATRPCHRCNRPVPVGYADRLEALPYRNGDTSKFYPYGDVSFP